MRIALDCANGSASITAPEFFMQMGAECDVLSNEPDGVNINDNCGSTHLENLQNMSLSTVLWRASPSTATQTDFLRLTKTAKLLTAIR